MPTLTLTSLSTLASQLIQKAHDEYMRAVLREAAKLPEGERAEFIDDARTAYDEACDTMAERFREERWIDPPWKGS